jgi:hypothetical protein
MGQETVMEQVVAYPQFRHVQAQELVQSLRSQLENDRFDYRQLQTSFLEHTPALVAHLSIGWEERSKEHLEETSRLQKILDRNHKALRMQVKRLGEAEDKLSNEENRLAYVESEIIPRSLDPANEQIGVIESLKFTWDIARYSEDPVGLGPPYSQVSHQFDFRHHGQGSEEWPCVVAVSGKPG